MTRCLCLDYTITVSDKQTMALIKENGNVSHCVIIITVYVNVLQDWLASSARKVGLAGRPMEWLTPLGLPVVQPYHKVSAKSVRTLNSAL